MSGWPVRTRSAQELLYNHLVIERVLVQGQDLAAAGRHPDRWCPGPGGSGTPPPIISDRFGGRLAAR
jgi:hypothetical protein